MEKLIQISMEIPFNLPLSKKNCKCIKPIIHSLVNIDIGLVTSCYLDIGLCKLDFNIDKFALDVISGSGYHLSGKIFILWQCNC